MSGGIAWWQVAILTIYSMYQILDEITIFSGLSQPVFAGFIAGLVMGDPVKGLIIGGSLQLTVLGVGTFGGASKIDANSGTIMATAFSIGFGMNPQTAVAAIGVPVASIMIETDILARFTNTYFQHRTDKMIENEDYKGFERNYLYGVIPWSLSRGIPVFLALAFGGSFVTAAVKVLNGSLMWLNNGLATAGGLLPAVGFAILLRYLPVKKHIAYLILGFTITALLSTVFTNIQTLGTAVTGLDKHFTSVFNSVPMLAIALIGVGLAFIEYRRTTTDSGNGNGGSQPQQPKANDSQSTDDNSEGEIYGDED